MASQSGDSRPADDLFQTPLGEWHSIYRAITFDNWLIWADALPVEPDLRSQLSLSVSNAITLLADALHQDHQSFPNYRRLGSSPYTIGRWWDPTDQDEGYGSGDCVLLRLDGFSASDLQRRFRGGGRLAVQPITAHWAEITLLPAGADASHREQSSDDATLAATRSDRNS